MRVTVIKFPKSSKTMSSHEVAPRSTGPRHPLRAVGAAIAQRLRNGRNARARDAIAQTLIQRVGIPPDLADAAAADLGERLCRTLSKWCARATPLQATLVALNRETERADLSPETRTALAALPDAAAREVAEILAVVDWCPDSPATPASEPALPPAAKGQP